MHFKAEKKEGLMWCAKLLALQTSRRKLSKMLHKIHSGEFLFRLARRSIAWIYGNFSHDKSWILDEILSEFFKAQWCHKKRENFPCKRKSRKLTNIIRNKLGNRIDTICKDTLDTCVRTKPKGNVVWRLIAKIPSIIPTHTLYMLLVLVGAANEVVHLRAKNLDIVPK